MKMTSPISVLVVLAVCTGAFADDIAVTQSPTGINLCANGGVPVTVTLSATILNMPTPDSECALVQPPTWSWSGVTTSSGSTATVVVTNTPPHPSGSVSAAFGEQDDGYDGALCDGVLDVGPESWNISVNYNYISASITGGQTDYLAPVSLGLGLSTVCRGVEYSVNVTTNSPYTVQWSATGPGSLVTDAYAGQPPTKVLFFPSAAGSGLVKCVITTDHCTKIVSVPYTIHSQLETTTNPATTVWGPWSRVPGLYSQVYGGTSEPWSFTASVTVTAGLSAGGSVSGEVLAGDLGFSLSGSAQVAITVSQNFPTPAVMGVSYGVYYRLPITTQTGTWTQWNCDGTSTTGTWTNTSYGAPDLDVANIATGP
jgi:hypothetical protein